MTKVHDFDAASFKTFVAFKCEDNVKITPSELWRNSWDFNKGVKKESKLHLASGNLRLNNSLRGSIGIRKEMWSTGIAA